MPVLGGRGRRERYQDRLLSALYFIIVVSCFNINSYSYAFILVLHVLCMLFIYHHYSVLRFQIFHYPTILFYFFPVVVILIFCLLDYKTGFGGEYGVQSGKLNYKI